MTVELMDEQLVVSMVVMLVVVRVDLTVALKDDSSVV